MDKGNITRFTLAEIIYKRTIKEAEYMCESKATVRQIAKVFSVSKSTVFKDMVDRLPKFDYNLYLKVKEILNLNKNERHIRGGIATKKKFSTIKEG